MSRWFIGVDPGLSGAVAALSPDTGGFVYFATPTLVFKRNGKSKRHFDHYEFARKKDELLDLIGVRNVKRVVIEKVGAMPGQGSSSMFSFGTSNGAAIQAFADEFLPIEFVSPVKWKRVMQCTADKDSSRARASQLLPRHASAWSLAKDDGVAEASLLALYGVTLK